MAKKNIDAIINSPTSILGNFNAHNLLLLNAYYSRGNRAENIPDVCTVVYKDTTDGSKHMMEIENPLLRMYVVKEKYRDYTYYPEVVEKSKCDTWTFPYHDVLKQIIKLADDDMVRYVKQCRESGNAYSVKKLHHCPAVLGTDFPYENYFRIEWMLNYADPNVNTEITKQFLDIEVDGIDIPGTPEEGNCPINAITVIDEPSKTVFTFLLRNPKNPQIEEFEKNIDGFIAGCHDDFDEFYGKMEYKIYMYDEEIELIKDCFKMVNMLKRDFLLIWNLPFDIPYIMDRIKVLGYNPIDIMCHPDFQYPYCWFKKDTRNFDFKTKKNIFRLASYTIFQDQLTNYAKVRKGQAELQSVKLNSIAKAELGDEKLDYSDEANIKTLPYVDYPKFVRYNQKDVLLQMGIERKTHDLEAIFHRAYFNATDYDSIFSQTIFLKNRIFLDYYRQLNLIKGNNINIKYDDRAMDEKADDEGNEEEYELDDDGNPDWAKPKSKGYEGALVGDPLLNSYEGEVIYGKQSMYVFNYVIDFDFSSLYPFTIISHNIGQLPLVGKVVLKDRFLELNQDPNNRYYDASKELFEDLETKNYSITGKKWFGLPTTEEILEEMEKSMK